MDPDRDPPNTALGNGQVTSLLLEYEPAKTKKQQLQQMIKVKQYTFNDNRLAKQSLLIPTESKITWSCLSAGDLA